MKNILKKHLIFLLILSVVAVCFASCAAENPQPQPVAPEAPASPEASDVPAPDAPPPPPPYNATIEYGEPGLITDNTGPLLAYIRFPVVSGPADEIISGWANSLYQNSRTNIQALRAEDPEAVGEVNVQFDSYLADDRYAGILENGMFTSSHLAHPLSVVRTFNIDTKTGALLKNSDILDYSQLDDILALLHANIIAQYPETDGVIGEMGENWLENIAIGDDGLIVALERGAFLPSYLGTLKITLSYGDLGDALVLGAAPAPQAPSAEPPSPAPIPNVPPSPAPIPNVPPQSGDIDPSKPMIALTFDDGPSKYTPQILDLLEKYGCRATFCVVGNLVNARRDTVKRASDLGCEIIGHSWDHRDLSKLTPEEIQNELISTSDIIESVTGNYPRLYRPPYGAVSATLKSTSAELGFAMINWSVDPLDWKNRNKDMVYNAIISNAGNRAIVLSHDLYGSTADAMERVIPELLSEGYQLVTVSELMYYSGKTLEAGVVYNSGR